LLPKYRLWRTCSNRSARIRRSRIFSADCAAIEAARFVREFAREALEIREFQRGEETEGVERGFIEAPAAKEGKDAFALGRSIAVGG
jgi:hypothetical protein